MILIAPMQIALLALVALAVACGKGSTPDGPTAQDAFPKLLEQAKMGNASAQIQVGGMLRIGDGVKQDLPEAYMWLVAAKANGEEDAAGPIVKMIETGGELSAEQIKSASDKAAALPKQPKTK